MPELYKNIYKGIHKAFCKGRNLRKKSIKPYLPYINGCTKVKYKHNPLQSQASSLTEKSKKIEEFS